MATAIESMTGIRIKSDFFSDATDMHFFPPHSKPPKNNRVALLYGKNGSGKSTIAQGFREYRYPPDPPAMPAIDLNPTVGESAIKITGSNYVIGDRGKIFVYDEKYVEGKIKISDSGLDSIVLFGEQIELEEKIGKVAEEINALHLQEIEQNAECDKFANSVNIVAPSYWIAKIKASLQQKNGWAEIDSKIKGNKANSAVNESLIDRIGIVMPIGAETEIKTSFDSQYSLFVSTNKNSNQLALVSEASAATNLESEAQALLMQTIPRPSLTPRESELLNIFNIGKIASARTFLSDSVNNVCPNCLQTISDEYRAKILQSIENILNREVESFQIKLKNLIQPMENIVDYQCYNVLGGIAATIQNAVTDYNKSVTAHNDALQQKLDNPFEPLRYTPSSIGLAASIDALNLAIVVLNIEIEAYNDTIKKRKSTEKSLLEYNDMIAHLNIVNDYVQLDTQRKEKAIAEALLKSIRDEKISKEQEKIRLDSLRQNFQIAADKINQSLEYIFFSRERLSLELGADQLYYLKVNGHSVVPSKVSCGERNALALSYFFTEISRNMDAAAIYSDEVLLIIDDPVSSFDMENRVGILSFLRWKLEQVLEACATTKLLIMTHDVSVVFDMQKSLGEISKHCKEKSVYAECITYQLSNKKLMPFNHRSHNEYTQLLCGIYQYATNTSEIDYDLIIGNVMRRTLEAFSSFSYKKGIEDVSLDQQVLATLVDEKSRNYYRNLMYRLVLNGESHLQENTQGSPEAFFFTHLSRDEKQRTAKDILSFMYQLNRPHILAHLVSCADVETNLQNWSASIR